MDNYTFDEGIEPGGLRDRADIKVLVCYIVGSIDEKISRSQLCEIALEQAIANYFEVNQAVTELLESRNLVSDFEDGEELLSITESGREAAKSLETTLPRSIREKAINAAIKLLTTAKNRRENTVEVEKLEMGGFNVTFVVSDARAALMKLTVFVADSMQVETLKQNFFDDPVKLYSSIITALTV